MTKIIDCPHCHIPLSEIGILYTVQHDYLFAAKLEFNSDHVAYVLRHRDNHKMNVSNSITAPWVLGYTFCCISCTGAIDLEKHGWSCVDIKDINTIGNVDIIKIIPDTFIMEENL